VSDKAPSLSAPRYWPTWLLVGLTRLIVILPFGLQTRLGAGLGKLAWYLQGDRRDVTLVNLSMCYPELSERDRHTLAKRVFRSVGVGLIETANSWLGDVDSLRDRCSIDGLEALQSALEEGNGVLLLGMHFATLDLCGAILAKSQPFDVMYRPNKNSVLEHMMAAGRERHFPSSILRNDTRAMIRSLRAGHALWYGPDQDYGPAHSVFAPFMGQQAASVSATARIAAMTGAKVVVFSHWRNEQDGTYRINLAPMPPPFPTDNPEADAARVNQVVEQAIAEDPTQYWWIHRRFKTRPSGEPRPYLPRVKQIKLGYLEHLADTCTLLQGTPERPGLYLSPDDEIYKMYYARRRFSRSVWRIPAMRFARNGRALHRLGIRAPLAKALYRFSPKRMHIVLYNRLEGEGLREAARNNPEHLAGTGAFLAMLHANGVHFRGIHLGNVLTSAEGLALVDVADLNIRSAPLLPTTRARNIAHILNHPDDAEALTQFGRQRLVHDYLTNASLPQWAERVFQWQLRHSLIGPL